MQVFLISILPENPKKHKPITKIGLCQMVDQ